VSALKRSDVMITVMNMATGEIIQSSTVPATREAAPEVEVAYDCPTLALQEVESAAVQSRAGMPPELADRPIEAFLAEFD